MVGRTEVDQYYKETGGFPIKWVFFRLCGIRSEYVASSLPSKGLGFVCFRRDISKWNNNPDLPFDNATLNSVTSARAAAEEQSRCSL